MNKKQRTDSGDANTLDAGEDIVDTCQPLSNIQSEQSGSQPQLDAKRSNETLDNQPTKRAKHDQSDQTKSSTVSSSSRSGPSSKRSLTEDFASVNTSSFAHQTESFYPRSKDTLIGTNPEKNLSISNLASENSSSKVSNAGLKSNKSVINSIENRAASESIGDSRSTSKPTKERSASKPVDMGSCKSVDLRLTSMEDCTKSDSIEISSKIISTEFETESTFELAKDRSTFKPLKDRSTPKPTEGRPTPKPTEGRSTPKLTEGRSTPNPTEDRSTPKPTEDRSTPKPIEDGSTSKLTEDRSTLKPTGDTSTSKLTEDRTTSKLTEDRSTPKSSRNMSTSKSTKDRSSSKSAENISAPKPTEDRSTPKPTADRSPSNTTKDRSPSKPTKDLSAPKPTEDRSLSKPSKDTSTPKPTEDSSTPEPTTDTSTPKPVEDRSTCKPKQNISTSKPTKDISSLESTEGRSTPKPTEDKSKTKPTEDRSSYKSTVDKGVLKTSVLSLPPLPTPDVPESSPLFSETPSLTTFSQMLFSPVAPFNVQVLPYLSHVPFMYAPIESQNDTQSIINPVPILPGIPDTERAPTDTKRSPTDTKRSPTDTKKSPTDTERSPTDTERAPTDTERSPTDTKRSPMDTKRSPTNTERSPTDNLLSENCDPCFSKLDSSPDLVEDQTKKPKKPRLLIYSKKPKDSSKVTTSSENGDSGSNAVIYSSQYKTEDAVLYSPPPFKSDVKFNLLELKPDFNPNHAQTRLKISFRKDIFNDVSGKLEPNLCSDKSCLTVLPNFILGNDPGRINEVKLQAVSYTRSTQMVRGGRRQSSGRLGDKRYFMTRILTSMNKLARNPLLNRPLAFKSFTFDATPLIRMRGLDAHEVKARKRNKNVLNDVTNCNEEGRQGTIRPKIFKSRAGERKNQLWKSSKMNSRIKTMISKNGTIQMIVDKSEEGVGDHEAQEVSKYFKIRNHSTAASSSTSSQSTSPPIKLKIPRSRLTEFPGGSKLVLKISKRKLKKMKKHKSKKAKREKNRPPKTMKVKYKNMYGRVIEYAKNLQPEDKF